MSIAMPNTTDSTAIRKAARTGRKGWMCLAFLLAIAGFSGHALAAGATSQRDVNPTGGALADGSDGLRWWLGSNSQLQVNLGGSGQVYHPTARPNSGSMFNSVYLRVDRGTDDTTRVYHNSDTSSGTSGTLSFTQVSQTGISGSGTAASPWQVTTVLAPSDAADSGITVTILDSYVLPQMWLTRRVALSGLPTSGASVKFYQNIDTYLQGGDNGPGFTRTSPWNTTGIPDIVGVVKGEQFQALWYEPSSGTPHWDRYSSEYYEFPGRQICRGDNSSAWCLTGTGNLLNTIDPNPATDNGMAVQWDVPAGASSFVVEYRVTFAMGAVDLTKAFEPETINAGGVSTLTFNLNNRTINAVDSIDFTDTLPAEVQVAAVPNIRTSCPAGGTLGSSLPSGMTVNATPGSSVIQIAGASVNGAPTSGELACQIAVDVTSSVVGEHHNTNASISGTNNLVNLVGDETLTVLAPPELVVAKSVDGTLVAGQVGVAADGHYLITITNAGTGTAEIDQPIEILDTLPAGFTATEASSAEGTVDCGTLPSAGPLPCTFTPASPIAVSGSVTIRINVAIDSSVTGEATNVVGVAGGGDPDPMPACPDSGNEQCAEVTTPLSLQADLQIVKTNNEDVLLSGQETTYEIVVTNNGPGDANGAVIRDPAPAGLTCTAVSCGNALNGAVCPAVSVAALQGAGVVIDTLPVTGSLTFTMTCTVTEP